MWVGVKGGRDQIRPKLRKLWDGDLDIEGRDGQSSLRTVVDLRELVPLLRISARGVPREAKTVRAASRKVQKWQNSNVTHWRQVQSCSPAGPAGTPETGWEHLSAAAPDH